MLVTNDGELANKLTHPRYGAEKRYVAVVTGQPGSEALRRLRQGVTLEDGPTAPAQVQRLHDDGDRRARLELVLKEGRNHQVKRMCEAVGHRVLQLRRESFAGLDVRRMAPGATRPLRPQEIARLRTLVGLTN